MQQRADVLYNRAGADNGEGFIIKRKWMRWRTFNRLMDLANDLGNAADVAFVCRLSRLGYAGVDEAIADLICPDQHSTLQTTSDGFEP